jgi:hypothetical protein
MSTAADRIARIRKALEQAGLDWLFAAPDADERASALANEFTEAEDFYNGRYRQNLQLLDKVETEPELYKPFLQSIGLPLSKEIRTVILRLLEGREIRELEFQYRKNGDSALLIKLDDEYPDIPIRASSPWDALLLPQLGYLVSDEKLELAGIVPWKMPEGAKE